MSNWQSAPFCDDCWDQRNPGKPSPRAMSGPSERCHGCGQLTRSGIYIKTDTEAEPAAPSEANGRFISSVAIATVGGHQHVTVFIRGRNVGTLVCGLDEGGPLQALLQCGNLLMLDRSGLDQGDPTGLERFEWTTLASNWLDVEEITGPTGFVGRIVLRLLHALEVAESEKAALLALRARWTRAPIPPRPPDEWLIKDFNVLYRVTRGLLLAVGAGNEATTARALNAVASQLERLKPAYTLTETVRTHARETGKIEPAPADALESYERTKRAGEGD